LQPAAVQAVETAVNNLRDDIREEKRNQFLIAGLLYTILGVAIAMFLAGTALQAFVIGAGWTSFLGSLGLKGDYSQRKEVKDDAIKDLQTRIEELEPAPSDRTIELKTDADVALAI
jgi:hypothetical protein